ncbi:MAG: GNAT family N-acetyltransferase [Candidatus Acidiferrales bacterium]
MWQPERVRIIEAGLADAAALQSLHITTWMATYRGLVPESFYRERSTAHGGRDWADLVRRQRAGGGGVLIARSYGRISGLCQYGPTEDDDDDPVVVGQVHRLYVHPLRQRQGIGRSLLSRATACLQGKGMVEVTLWVLERDSGARAFYEHLGWQSDGSRRFDGATDVRYRWPVREGSLAGHAPSGS